MSTVTIDGYFATPREVEGSPEISTDDVTLSIIVKRKFAVLTSSYQPTTRGLFDPIFGYPFIFEATGQVSGSITFFDRTFASVPAPRTETRMVPFTRPGQPAVQISTISQKPIGWTPYGLCSPYTRLILANVNFSYQINPFSPSQAPANTTITYQGVPVDYFGSVFVPGRYVIVATKGNLIPELQWVQKGQTNPPFLPSTWVQSTNVSRWKGPIWQMETVIFPNVS